MSYQAFSQRSIKELVDAMRERAEVHLQHQGYLPDGTPIHVVVQLGHAMPERRERLWRLRG
jgi:hypothetical protein